SRPRMAARAPAPPAPQRHARSHPAPETRPGRFHRDCEGCSAPKRQTRAARRTCRRREGSFVSLLLLILLPAFRTELRRSLGLVAALGAGGFEGERGAAVVTELAALRLRAAFAADSAADRSHVALFGPVDGTRFLVDLFARGLGLRGGHLFIHVGRARFAEPGFLVPAYRLANPVAAARALLERRR